MSLNKGWELSSLSTKHSVHNTAKCVQMWWLIATIWHTLKSVWNQAVFISSAAWDALSASWCLHYFMGCLDLILDPGSFFHEQESPIRPSAPSTPQLKSKRHWCTSKKNLIQFASFCLWCWAPGVWVWFGLTKQRKWEDLQN